MCDASGAEKWVTTHVSVRHLYTQTKVDVTGYRHGRTKTRKGPVGAGHACLQWTRGIEGWSPSVRESHCKVQDDVPKRVILKVTSMTNRADSLRVLVNSGTSNNSVRQQCLPLLDFAKKHVPRSQLEVRLATGATMKTEKRVICAHFSYKHRVFVEELLVLALNDKFDMVLVMPWLARHDPIIDWEKHTDVHFGRRSATESDGSVRAADTPNGASKPPIERVARTAVSGRSARVITTPGVVDRKECLVRDPTLPRNHPP
ncbi:reverse transcriptase [Phytophthora megakarya]|uniref:Reverse transcriptase n=1 Tax=Phytophthora megakarya TaxID=4795 RepID=A0A225VPN6_9STRA|nr:reverse transcriptase [Phytophthora megakarya]